MSQIVGLVYERWRVTLLRKPMRAESGFLVPADICYKLAHTYQIARLRGRKSKVKQG